MSAIKTRIVFLDTEEQQPLFTTDLEYVRHLKITGDASRNTVHKISKGTEIDIEGRHYEIIDISSNMFNHDYGNEGIILNCKGERNPYNFDVIYKLRKKESMN